MNKRQKIISVSHEYQVIDLFDRNVLNSIFCYVSNQYLIDKTANQQFQCSDQYTRYMHHKKTWIVLMEDIRLQCIFEASDSAKRRCIQESVREWMKKFKDSNSMTLTRNDVTDHLHGHVFSGYRNLDQTLFKDRMCRYSKEHLPWICLSFFQTRSSFANAIFGVIETLHCSHLSLDRINIMIMAVIEYMQEVAVRNHGRV